MSDNFIKKQGSSVCINVDVSLYPADSVLKAAHRYSGKYQVHLETKPDGNLVAMFNAATPDVNIEQVAGDFMNDLLDQCLRDKLSKETEVVRNLILAHALSQTDLLDAAHAPENGNIDSEQ